MYLSMETFRKIDKALLLIDYSNLTETDSNMMVDLKVELMEMFKKHKKDNEKTRKYIADKRKLDKNYARSKKG